MSGATIYAYVGGNPIRYTDPLGLYYAELYGAGGATLGAYAGAGLAGVGAAAGDIGTLGGNILLNPAEVAGGYALGGLVGGGFGYAVGSGLDWLSNQMNASFPPGYWPGDKGGAEWGRRNGVGGAEGRRKFHGIKQGCKGQGAKGAQDFGVNPDTGDVINPEGDVVGNLND